MVEIKKMNRQRKERNRGKERKRKKEIEREREKEWNGEKQKQGFPHPVISDNRNNTVLWVEMDNLSNSTISNSSLILSFLSFILP